jgi:hypothetical protein
MSANPALSKELAAEQLGLPLDTTFFMAEKFAKINPYNLKLHEPRVVWWQDDDGLPIWEVAYVGTLETPEQLTVQYYFVIGVQGMQRVHGSSQLDDKYKVIAANGSLLFEGTVISGRQDHTEEWAGYSLFDPVRDAVVKASATLIMTGRLNVEAGS